MSSAKIQDIVIIGAGRLATHLGQALFRLGLNITQVYNRTPEKGMKLAAKIGASFTADISNITLNADLYILAVSDSVIEYLAKRLRLHNRLVVHASGTVSMDILAEVSGNIGVFYPVQTFSLNRKPDFRKIPVCVEGNSAATAERLSEFAGLLTKRVYRLDSDQRRLLHLGAVFASNFTNSLYAVTEELLASQHIPLELLEPLIMQTAGNLKHGNLIHFQTGPAARGDAKVLEKHYEMLANHPDFLAIYKIMSENIIKQTSGHGKL
jgi:predicted short-subunit dehydrogenase-like oxidoreductase (DUF2520 family)